MLDILPGLSATFQIFKKLLSEKITVIFNFQLIKKTPIRYEVYKATPTIGME